MKRPTHALLVACPVCLAAKGATCISVGYKAKAIIPIKTPHIERRGMGLAEFRGREPRPGGRRGPRPQKAAVMAAE